MADFIYSALMGVSILLIVVVAFLVLVGFMHAFAAKQITGKWPHQSAHSKGVYDALNNVGAQRADDGEGRA